jgi:lipid-A-disaccharide synthase
MALSSTNSGSFMLIAGEASGDTLGTELVKALKAENPSFQFFGAGGAKMEKAGVEIALDLAAHAVVGIWEVLKNYGKFKAFFEQLLNLTMARKPEFIILIDYPGFNLRFAKAVRERAKQSKWTPKIVYYVSPQIWAWHESRIDAIARDINLMLAIFPFEKGWYAERRPEFKVEFVGHPLIDRFASEPISSAPPSAVPRVLLLPGSRRRELNKHLPPMVEALRQIKAAEAVEATMVLPDEKLRDAASMRVNLEGIQIQIGGLAQALASATIAIASSGTVTMECAYFQVPTVVLYKTSASTYFLGRRFIKVKHLAMPNLLAGQEVYPEFIQGAATPENIARASLELLNNRERRNVIKTQLRRVIESLGEPGASERAAKAILRLR